MDAKSGEEVGKDTYDSVFYATGRKADTSGIGLEAIGVKVGRVFPPRWRFFRVVVVGVGIGAGVLVGGDGRGGAGGGGDWR